jgi:hypothetical protein
MSLSSYTQHPHAGVCLDLGTALSKASVWIGGDGPERGEVAPLPIGAAAGAEHPLLTPSAMYVDDGRIFFGPAALRRAENGVAARRNPIVSFKLILSAREIEPTLALKMNPSVDPTGTLRHRDSLILYLAYLDQLIRAAVAAESTIPASAADAPRRLTSPHWQSFDEAGRVIARLVDEAGAVSAHLGRALLNEEGLPLAGVRDVLEAAKTTAPKVAFDGLVFESISAASAYANFARSADPYVLVIDMGAGTTDIAAFERDSATAPARLTEIAEARQCSALAGDELDNIVIDLFVRAGGKRALAAQDKLWRAVKLSAKSLKHDVFQKGRGVFWDRKTRIVVSRDTLSRDASFRAYCRAFTHTVANSLAPLYVHAKETGAGAITILLAGGGSNLPFLANLVRAAAAKAKVKITLKIERFGSNWTLPHRHHPFAGVLPQLAIAMGGALAPLATAGRSAAVEVT